MNQKELKRGIYKTLNVESLGLDMDSFYYRDKYKRSIGFYAGENNRLDDFYIKIFNLPNKEKFYRCFNQSIRGDGGEISKDDALRSSSLCALLTFYNVSKENPMEIKYGDGSIHIFDNVYFEIKNNVFSKNAPSNMDVVLTNDETKEILFIECKFSEFLSRSKHELGKAYKVNKETNKIFNDIYYKNMEVFQYGIKQLVAHFIGIKNFIKGYKLEDIDSFYDLEDFGRKEVYEKDKYNSFSFMEVVFELDEPNYVEYLKETEKTFNRLKEEHSEINILGTTTYQELFKGNNLNVVPKLVKEFYKLG